MRRIPNATEVGAMKELFENGKLTRREFLQGLGAIGVTAAAAGSILTTSSAIAASHAQPKRGGRLRFAWDQHGPADTLDPALFTSTIDYLRGRAYYNNLVQFQDDMQLGPDLAEEFSSNSDATEWTFKLRKGVTFHDGAPFTADDVVYSMNRHLGEDSTSKASSLVTMVTEWKKVDSHTVKAMLSSPNADLAAILGTFHFKIIQNGAEGEYFQKPNGTGPFKVKDFTPGVRSLGVRNDNYFRDGRPYLDELETFAITDSPARVSALISGDCDICGNLDPKAIKQIESTDGVEVFSVESGAYPTIVAMRDRAPGNNLDFVTGLKYLQRRDRIVKSIFKGQAVVGNDHPVAPAYAMHCKDLPQRPYDPDKAKFHLNKSGIKQAELQVADVGAGLVDMCLLLQREAAKVGLTLDVKRVPADGYWGAIWMKQPLHVSSWNMRPTANVMLTLAYAPEAPWNETQYKTNKTMDDLLQASRAETDVVKRQQMFCDMQEIVTNEYGSLIPVHRNYVDAVSTKVKGLTRVPLAATGGCEWADTAWLDA